MQAEKLSEESWETLSNISSFMKYLQIRKTLPIFGQLDAQLDYCQFLIRSQMHKADETKLKHKKRKKQLTAELVKALSAIRLQQRICLFNVLVDQIFNLVHGKLSPPPILSSFLIVEAFSKSYNLKIWKRKKLRFDRQKHIIYAQKDKKIKNYDLRNYIVRKSTTSDYLCFVLQAINTVPLQKSKTVHLGFQFKNTYNLWFQSVRASICYQQWERLVDILKKRSQIQKYQTIKILRQKEEMIVNEQRSFKNGSSCSFKKTKNKREAVEGKIQLNDLSVQDKTVSVRSDAKNHPKSIQIKATSPSSIPEILDEVQIISRCFTYQLINSKLNLSIEELQYQLQKETQVTKGNKMRVPIHSILLEGYNLNHIAKIANFEEVKLNIAFDLQQEGETYAFKSVSNPNNIKFFFLSPLGVLQKGYSSQNLFRHIIDPNTAKEVNSGLQSVQIKAVIRSQRSTVNIQEHIPYNRLFRPRDFSYIRHILRDTSNQYFCIDRTIQQPMLPVRNHLVRGTIKNITRISQNQQQIMLVMDITLENKGLNQQQNTKQLHKYIQTLSTGLNHYFKEPLITKSTLDIYNLELPLQLEQIESLSSEQPQKALYFSFTNRNQSFDQSLSINTNNIKNQVLRIPRTKFLFQKNKLLESMYESETSQALEPMCRVRRTYQPAHRANRDYLNPKITFFNSKGEDGFDWKRQVQPEWTRQWKVGEKGGLVYRDQDPKYQELLKQVLEFNSKIALSTDNSERIYFPIDVMAPQSNLERMVKALSYAPSLFTNTSQLSSYQKLKKTVVFALLTSLMLVRVQKSFFPLLGETYQSQIPSSCQGYAEQISFQQASLMLVNKQFVMNATVEPKLNVRMNTSTGSLEGNFKIQFSDDTEICFTLPSGQLSGLTYGQLTFSLSGKSYFWIQSECLILELQFEVGHIFSTSQQAQSDCFQGMIYHVTPQFMTKFMLEKSRPQERHILRTLEKVSGRWTKSVSFKDQTIYLDKIPLYEMTSELTSLPSDCIVREDINQLKLGRLQHAQVAKQALQEQEHHDKELRQTPQHW